MVWAVGTWCGIMGSALGFYFGWRSNYVPKPKTEVQLAKAIGEAIAKATGIEHVGVIDPSANNEGVVGMWDTVEEVDPWMEFQTEPVEEQ